MADILIGGSLKPNEQNIPTRAGELINSIAEISSIPNPRVGMEVWIADEGKAVKILSLKEKTIAGVVVPNAMVDRWEYIDARLQGTSESSDPMADPFVKLSAGGAAALAELLDSTTNKGRYRVDFGGYVLIDVNVFVRNSGVIVQSISGFIDKYDGGIDVAEKKNTFLRKGTPTEDAISWSEWAAVEGSNVRKITEENVAALNEEIARATAEEAELLARLQGTSENVDGRTYPFVKKDCANFDAIVQFLDEECISGDNYNETTTKRVAYTGFTRVFLAGSFFAEVQIFFRNYANGFCTQVVKGNICIKDGEIANVIKNDMPYVTVWRNHTADGWGEWHLTDAELVGKSIAFFGGSMCHLAVGGGSLTQYTDATKSETFTEKVGYLREQVENLGATVANYAVSGSGFLRPIDGKTIYSQAQAAGEHDIYVIWASTNDWTMGTYNLGEFDDYQRDGVIDSICGGLNATISILLDKKRDAKIYVFLPMKGVDTRGFDPANGKYGNAMFDILTPAWKNPMGYTFGEYMNAVLKVCAFRGVAVVDTFSSPNLMYRAISDSAITGLYWNEGLLVGGSDVYQGYFVHPRRAGYKAVWGTVKKSLLGDYGEHVVQQAAIYSEQLRAQGVESDLQEQIEATNNSIPTAQSNGTAVSSADKKYAYRGTGDNDIVAGAYWSRYAASVDLKLKKWGSTEMGTQNLPAATTELAGVMSAEDKQILTAMLERIATLEERIAALEELHAAIEATVTDNNLTLSGDGVEVADNNLTLPEDKVTLEDNNLIIN